MPIFMDLKDSPKSRWEDWKKRNWFLEHVVSNFLYYKVCNQKWQPSESRAYEQLWGPQWKLIDSGIDEPLPPQFVLGSLFPTDWQQTWKFCWNIDAAWGTSALRGRMDKVPYHTEWFSTLHKEFLEKHGGNFYSYCLHVNLEKKQIWLSLYLPSETCL